MDIASPSTDIPTIEARLDLVQTFLEDEVLRNDIIAALDKSHDSQRILQKFSLGRGDPDDSIALARTIQATAAIRDRLKLVKNNKSLNALIEGFDVPSKLADKILRAIDEEGLMEKQRVEQNEAAKIRELAGAVVSTEETIRIEEEENVQQRPQKKRGFRRIMKEEDREKTEPWIMQRNASPTLKRLHQHLDSLIRQKDDLEDALRNELSILRVLSLKAYARH